MRIFTGVIIVFVLCFAGTFSGMGQNDSIQNNKKTKKKISFRYPEDNAFDVSSFLLEHKGIMPVIMPITEPAVGYGGSAIFLYFHTRKKKYDTYVPPDISGVAGLYTQNKTWGVGAFHMHTFGENRVRTITAFAKPDIRFKYYGNNSDFLNKYPIKVNLKSWLFYQKAQVRLAESNFYAGASYTFLRSEIGLDTITRDIPGRPIFNYIIRKLNTNSTISTIKPMIIFDNRDNIFTPTKGIEAEISVNYSAKWLGADDNYYTGHTKFYGYFPIVPKLYSGWRFKGSYLFGDAPFYAYPFVSLRGIPAMRYQSDNVLEAETEWRYNFYKRWSVLGFSGVGKAFQDLDSFNDIEFSYNIGTGFRYELARALGTHMGLDFAWGNARDFAFYVVFGSSW